jgi:large subunit ribosomal protein L18
MTMGPRYNVKPRRRREGRTDYRRRLNLLRSGKTRLVVRKTLKNTIIQFINYKEGGDNILVTANSNELKKKYGWKFSTSTTPAAYLTGLLAGKKAKDKGIDECVFDIGRHPPVKGSRIFASLKGITDSGIECPHSEENIPTEDRLMGKHLDDSIMSTINNIKKEITGGK